MPGSGPHAHSYTASTFIRYAWSRSRILFRDMLLKMLCCEISRENALRQSDSRCKGMDATNTNWLDSHLQLTVLQEHSNTYMLL